MAERINRLLTTEILGDILDTLRFRSTIFLRSQLAAPWGFSFDPVTTPRFHISLGGEFFFGAGESRPPLSVKEMEIVLLPVGQSHWIADRPGRDLVPSERVDEACALARAQAVPGAATNQMMCGRTYLDPDLTHPLFAALPSVVHLESLDHDSRIWRLVQLIDAEIANGQALGSPIINRLTEALFLQLLQEMVARDEAAIGFVAALRDPQLRKVLRVIHQQPAEGWTIDDLAAQAAMSRASLIRRFRKSVGAAPIEYLTRWRLLKAHRLVKHSAHPIERVANDVGFSSAQTLTRAFKRQFGYPPNRLRTSSR